MAETQVLGWGTQSAPASRDTQGTESFVLLAIDATFDGTAATTSFVPAVQIISDAGEEVGTFPLDSAVAAGGSAAVTFAPFLRTGGSSSRAAPGTSLDYVEAPNGIFNVTATTAATANLWIQGKPIVFDGVTTATITVWVALGQTDRDLTLELFMDNIDQGRIGQISPGSYTFAGAFIGIGHVIPSVGTHTFDIRAWTDVGATSTLLNPAPFPAVAFQPSFYQVTASSPLT